MRSKQPQFGPYSHPVIIAGTGLNSEVMTAFIENSKLGTVCAFAIEEKYIVEKTFLDRPIVSIEQLEKKYSPTKHELVNTIGYNNMNETRERVSGILKAKGYTLPGFIHPSTSIDPTVETGDNFIAVQSVTVEPFTTIGDNVTLWAGCYVGHHSKLGNNVYVGPAAAIAGTVTIADNSFIGMNATVRSKVKIGTRCLIGAGAFINKDVPAKKVMKPNPAVASTKTSDDYQFFN